LKRMPVVVPPEEEQATIAAFLDDETAKIGALVAEQENLIALLAEKRQATISHAVTKGLNADASMKESGVAWLGEVPVHWGQSKKLVSLAARHQHAFVNGPFGSDLLTSELVSEGVPVIYIRDIAERGYQRVSEWCVTPGKAEQLKFCNVISGDVLIAKVGGPPGLAAVYPQGAPNAIVTQDVIRLRLDKECAHDGYVRWLLNSACGRASIAQISVESTRTRVGLGEYKQLRFYIPPLEEQTAISEFLDAEIARLNSLETEAERVVALLKERRGALIAAAITGQVDVRGAAAEMKVPTEEAVT
jgi:type I restriction enzyme, S subunit